MTLTEQRFQRDPDAAAIHAAEKQPRIASSISRVRRA